MRVISRFSGLPNQEQDQPPTDSTITDQSPTLLGQCRDKLLKPLWNLLTGSASQPTVDLGQDTGAYSHNAQPNQIPVQVPLQPTGQELAYSTNLAATLATSEPSQQKEPTESALCRARDSYITTEPGPTCTEVSQSVKIWIQL